ncbi:hypothetical protein ANAEL_04149 [Anaerolineales bacterium]|nr:hypothetical protein ANAEL_04149 [Anaerolineales bacterium]
MTNSFQEILQNISRDANTDASVLAPQALKVAFEWCRTALGRERFQDSFDALTGIGEFSIALDKGLECLASLDETVQFSEAGKRIETILAKGSDNLADLSKKILVLDEKLNLLREQDDAVRALESKKRELEEHIDKLEHASDLEKHIGDLEKQLKALKLHPPSVDKIQDLELDLANGVRPLVLLSREQLNLLEATVRDLLTELEGAQKKRDALIKKILQLKAEIGVLDQSEESYLRVLELYKDANRALTREFPEAQSVKDLLAKSEFCLRQSDIALKLLLEANEVAKKLPELSFSGGNV